MEEAPGETGGALRTIAAFKLLEAAVLLMAGLGALGLLDSAWNESAKSLLDQLSLHEGRRIVARSADQLLAVLSGTRPHRLMLIAGGSFVYAAIFVTEAVGLWLRKAWAKYLTLVVTASFLPFEFVGVIREPSPLRIATLVVNLLVMVYLVWNVLRERAATRDAPAAQAH